MSLFKCLPNLFIILICCAAFLHRFEICKSNLSEKSISTPRSLTESSQVIFMFPMLKTGCLSCVFFPTAIAWNLSGFACIQIKIKPRNKRNAVLDKRVYKNIKIWTRHRKRVVVRIIIQFSVTYKVKNVINEHIEKNGPQDRPLGYPFTDIPPGANNLTCVTYDIAILSSYIIK